MNRNNIALSNNTSISEGFLSGNIYPESAISGNITYGMGTGDNTEEYTGEYEIDPKAFESTVLNTRNKKLTQDVVVKPIQYLEVTNESGGSTIYIA